MIVALLIAGLFIAVITFMVIVIAAGTANIMKGPEICGLFIMAVGFILFCFALHRLDLGRPATDLPVGRSFYVEAVSRVGDEQHLLITGLHVSGCGIETIYYRSMTLFEVEPGDSIKRVVTEPEDFVKVIPKAK